MITTSYFRTDTMHGVVEKCPHCDRRNTPKKHKRQVTCGDVVCTAKQAELTRQRWNLKHGKGGKR